MLVRVTIRKRSEEIPEEFIYSVLMSTLRMGREDYERIKGKDGSVSVYVSDPEALLKLQEIGEKHSELIEITFEKDTVGGLFSASLEAVKANLGLALSWSAIFLLLALLSIIPILGFFLNIFLSVFIYSFIIYTGSELLKGDVKGTFRNLKLGEVFSKYISSGFGMWLATFLVSTAFIIFAFVLFAIFGSLGGISDLIKYGAFREGVALSALVVFLILFLIGLWVIYAYPMVIAKILEGGEPNFGNSFLAPFNLFKPSFIKETFSSGYLRIGGVWSLGVTVGTIGAVLLAALIITIPLALIILYWLNVFFAICAAESVRRR